MVVTDSIADFLNRIKNAQKARFDKLDIPSSGMKVSLARILKEEGYIKNFKVIPDVKQGLIRIHLKYNEHREAAMAGVKRISKPGCRVYVAHDEIPRVMNGLGITILSTSKGIMTDRQARKEHTGGELLCSVW